MLKKSKLTATLGSALSKALPALAVALLLAVSASVAALGALLCLVQLLLSGAEHWWWWSVGCWIASAITAGLASWLSHVAEANVAARLKRQVVGHMLRLPASTLSRYQPQQLKALLSDDIAALHHLIAHAPHEFVTLLVLPALTLVLWITLAGWPSLLALLPGLLAVICHLWWIPRLSAQLAPIQFNLLSKVASAVSDYGRAPDLLKLTDPAAGPLAEFNQASAQFVGMISSRVSKVSTAAALASALLQAVCTFAIGYTVVIFWQPATTDAGQLKALCAVLLFSLAIVTPALRLGHGLDYVAAGRAAAWRLADFLHIMPLQQGEQQFEPTAAPTLQLIDLGWQSQGKMLFQGLSTSLLAGQFLAITGHSGAGKSTLLRLIAGLENLQTGTVLLADQALASLTAASRQQLILMIPQGLAVMPGTVQQNLALTAPDASTDEYQQALYKAHLNTELSADAALLSGGEKQRLNLARVFLAKATVLLLDEPTSGLDPKTSLAVLQALIAHVRQHSCFLLLVTHQPEYAAMADLQLVLPTDGKEDKT